MLLPPAQQQSRAVHGPASSEWPLPSANYSQRCRHPSRVKQLPPLTAVQHVASMTASSCWDLQQPCLLPQSAAATTAAAHSNSWYNGSSNNRHICQHSFLQAVWGRRQRQRGAPCRIWRRQNSSSTQLPDPWQRQHGQPNPAADGANGANLGAGQYTPPGTAYNTVGSNGTSSNGSTADVWTSTQSNPVAATPAYEQTDWGWDSFSQDWDPAEGLAPEQVEQLEREYQEQLKRRRDAEDPPRDKWITPLLDWQSVLGAVDPDQSRTEDAMADEALTNKEESRQALAFTGRLVVVPLITGALISRAITGPVLGFVLQNNPNAFAMTERQKIEGAAAVHMEETRVRMMMAIGQAPPLNDTGMLMHLHEYALEVQEEERQHNEANIMTLVSDSISAMVFFMMFVRDTDGRRALFNTIGRLFEGLSDIAKAVMIILVADTLLGYHSEEGWTGFLDLVLGHYGIEVEEENIVLFVGIIPIAIDVWFKYWIFIGLNKISPGAVVTIKQLDRH